jgi:hypothetical protein
MKLPPPIRAARRAGFRAALQATAAIRRFTADVDQTIVLSGRPRSGTTWLEEMVCRITGYPAITEPLMLTNLPENLKQRYGLRWRTYRRHDADDPDFAAFLRSILGGTLLLPSFFPPRPETFAKLAAGSPVVVKFCRANLFLPYLHAQFPRNRTVLLVRNPFATAASQLALGQWDHVDEFVPHQPELYRDHPELVVESPPTTREEILTTYWCIEHAYLAKHLDQLRGVFVLRYEDMFRDPATHLPRLCEYLRVAWRPELLDLVKIKSRTTVASSALNRDGDPTRSYVKTMDPARRARLHAILERFGYPFYSPDELAREEAA